MSAILEALRAEVRARRLAQGHAEPGPAERELARTLDEIELYRVVSAHWPLLGKTLPQRAINLVNKLVRRYLRWYINPIVEQQNAYNHAVARALRLLAEAYAELGEQIGGHRPPATDHRPPTADKVLRTENQEHGSIVRSQLSVAEDNELRAADYRQLNKPHYPDLMGLVRARAAREPAARFPDLALGALAPRLRLTEQVSAHWPLGGATLPQRAIALANKLVRRYLRWYINPIVEQQNAANAAFTAALVAMMRIDAERRAEIAAQRAHEMKG
jgi:predicted nucleic acid-binding protein